MIWWIHFLVVISLYIVAKNIKYNNFFVVAVFLYIMFTFGQRWMTGEDFPGYLLYYLIDFNGTEPIYDYLQSFFIKHNIYFGLLIFLVYLITQINFLFFFTRFNYTNLLILLYCLMEIFFMEMSQIRQWAAISFFINSYYFSYNKKYWKSIILFLLGVGFHGSILILLPLLLLKPKFHLRTYFSIFSFFLFFPLIDVRVFLGGLENVFYSSYVGSVYDESLGLPHYLRYYLILFITLVYLAHLKINTRGLVENQVLNGHLFYFFLYGLSFQFAPFMRVSYYFKVYEILFLILLIPLLININKRVMKTIVLSIVLMLYIFIALLDPYNVSRYELRFLKLEEDKSRAELFEEIREFYLNVEETNP